MKPSLLAVSLSAAVFLAACTMQNSASAPSAASSGSSGAVFTRAATYPVYLNVPQGIDPQKETVAEISTVSAAGKTLIYTDAAGKRIGFLDISDLSRPRGAGSVSLATLSNADDQPTSVAAYGDYVLVVIDETGGNFSRPKGRMDVLRLRDRAKVASINLLGQPDSIAVSPDGRFAAIAMENQRDEERKDVDGGLPQMPPGFVQVIELSANPQNWRAEPVRFNDKNGAPLPIVAAAGLDTPQDVEPEYVSINAKNQAAVTLQENNGIAVIDLPSRRLLRVFSAGNVSAEGIDTKKDGLIQPSGSLKNVPREPDAVAWIGSDYLAVAHEGDWKGGSRGWSIFPQTANWCGTRATLLKKLPPATGCTTKTAPAKRS